MGKLAVGLLVILLAVEQLVGSVPVNFAVAAPMKGVLTVATVLLFTVLRTDLSLSTAESYALLAGHLLFVVWVVAESIGVSNLIKGA